MNRFNSREAERKKQGEFYSL